MELENAGRDVRNAPVPTTLLRDCDAVLIRGPALSGKYDLLLRLLAAPDSRALLVSTSREAVTAQEDFGDYGDPDELAVVDCATRVRGGDVVEDPLVRYAASPNNLTEIGVKFTDLVAALQAESQAEVVVGIHSLSELLMYADVEQVFQFLRILLGECAEFGWPVVATIDDSAVDERAVTTLTQPFDAVVRTRATDDDEHEFRIDGESDADWTPF